MRKKEPSSFLSLLTKLFLLFLPTQVGKFFWFPQSFVWGIRVDFLSFSVFLSDILILLLAVFSQKESHWLNRFLKKIKEKKTVASLIFILVFFNLAFSFRPLVSFFYLLRLLEFIFLVDFFSYFCVLGDTLFFLLLANIYVSFLSWGEFLKKASLNGIFYYLGERYFNLSTPEIARFQWGDRLFLRPYSTFSHPNSLAGFLLVSSLFLWALRRKFSSKQRFWLTVGTVFSLLTVGISFSWAAYLAFLLFLILLIGQKLGRVRAAAVFVFVSFLVFGSFRGGLIEERSVSERLFLAKNALQLIKERPLLGVGLGNFIPAQTTLSFPRGQYNFLQPVHNIYLLIATEAGLVGLGVFVIALLYLIKLARLKSSSFLFFALCAILFLGFFDHYWLTLKQNFFLAAVIVGVIIGRKR